MLDPLGPAQIADVDQAVDTIFDLDERAEVGQVSYPAFDRRAHRIFLMQSVPRISCKLPHAQRNPALLRVHVQHYAIDVVADIHQLRRMLHAFGPRHFADVHQSFDALLQFDKRAVISDADHASTNVCAHGITMFRIQPRIGRELLEAQRNALLVLVELQHLHLDLIAYVDQVAGMSEASPRHVGDVQQTIDAAEIDECAVVGEVLDHAGQDRAFLQVLQSLGSLFTLLAFQHLLARDHNVAALLVQLDDGNFETLALHRIQIARRTQVGLGAGKKCAARP